MSKEHIQNLTSIIWVSSSDIHSSLLVYGDRVIYFTGIFSFLFHKSEKNNTRKAGHLIREDTQYGFRNHLVCKRYSVKETTNYEIARGRDEYMATSRWQMHCLQPERVWALETDHGMRHILHFQLSTQHLSSSTMELFLHHLRFCTHGAADLQVTFAVVTSLHCGNFFHQNFKKSQKCLPQILSLGCNELFEAMHTEGGTDCTLLGLLCPLWNSFVPCSQHYYYFFVYFLLLLFS